MSPSMENKVKGSLRDAKSRIKAIAGWSNNDPEVEAKGIAKR
jgi:hypothetical protein